MILKTAQGRYRVKVKDHGVIVADRTFVRWNDAEHWEAERKQKVACGRLATSTASRIRLEDVYVAWSQIRPGQVEARTWQSDQSAWTSHLAARFGREPVGAITTVDVHGFAVELRRDRTAATVHRVIASLAALLAFAVDHYHYLEDNPARVRLALRRDPPRRHVTLEPADLIAVWRRQRNHSRLADVTLFLGLTGLRWGELIALRPCDIVHTVRAGPVLTITRSIVRAGGEGTPLVKATKANRDRLVPLSRVALQIADQWADGTHREDLLVTGRDGEPLGPSYFRRQVHWTQTVPAGLRIHDLRHSAATNLLKSGADILGVQGILGHSTSTTTLRFYAHVTGAEHLRTAMDHYEVPLAASLDPSGGASGATWPPAETLAFIGEVGNPQQ